MRAADRVRPESEWQPADLERSPFRSSRFRRSVSISRSGRSSGARRTPSTVGMAGPTGGFWSWTAGPSVSRSRRTGHPAPAAPGRGARSRPAGLRRARGHVGAHPPARCRSQPDRILPDSRRRPRARSTGAALLRPEAAAVPDPVRDPGQCLRLPAGHAVARHPPPQPTGGDVRGEPRRAGRSSLRLSFSGRSRGVRAGRAAGARLQPAEGAGDHRAGAGARERRLDLDALGDLDDAGAVERLQALRGVGRWTAEYALLRGLGRLHVFPGDDIGARNNLQRWLGILEPLDYEGVRRALARWAPFQGLVYLHLLLRGLQLASETRAGTTRRRGRSLRGCCAERERRSEAMSIDLKRAYDPPAAAMVVVSWSTAYGRGASPRPISGSTPG